MTNPTARETPDLREALERGVLLPEPEGFGWDLEMQISKRDLHEMLNRHAVARVNAALTEYFAATPEPAPPCRCEHPFSDHRTPGTECSVIGCDCEPYEPAPAVLDEERLAVALQYVYHGTRDGWRKSAAEILTAYNGGLVYDDPRDAPLTLTEAAAGSGLTSGNAKDATPSEANE